MRRRLGINLVVDNPGAREVTVSGKRDYESGKKVTAKIFNE